MRVSLPKRRILAGPIVIMLVAVGAFAQKPAFSTLGSSAQQTPTPVAPVSNPCPRLAAGGVVYNPPALYGSNGVLNVRFSYQQTTDSVGRLLHCFMTDTGLEEPTLHVNPGDTLNITVTNNTPPSPLGEMYSAPNCGDSTVEYSSDPEGINTVGSSMNIHYHGANVTPACHGDNVTRTLINSGSTFQYSFTFPTDEPPGLYWYHPHIHGLTERDLLGGATGALVVDGIQNLQPAVQRLRQRFLVIRDQPQLQGAEEGPGNCGIGVPFQDISVNYVPIDSHATFDSSGNLSNISFTPAVLNMKAGERELWRVVNGTADTILDLQVLYDGVPQTLHIVAIDSVPVNSQDGTQPGGFIPVKHFRLADGARVEFVVHAPTPRVKVAQLVTHNINTGPAGDCDPTRTIFNIHLLESDARSGDDGLESDASPDDRVGPFTGLITSQQRFGGLSSVPVSTTRTLQFSENDNTSQFFIAVEGETPAVFNPNNPPAVMITQGSVEQWNVQNISQENHDFHIHQIHYKVLSQDNFEVNGSPQAPAINGQFLDTIDVPFWDNLKNPNGPVPQVRLLMDFRGMDIGEFVYHCHILNHEDLGMMGVISVTPKR